MHGSLANPHFSSEYCCCMKIFSFIVLLLGCFVLCNNTPFHSDTIEHGSVTNVDKPYDSTCTTIHVMVALCDNTYQGIVPVPAAIGNGQNPPNNLYWGCGYGVKTFFKKSNRWKLIHQQTINDTLMERIILKHGTQNIYLIADAVNGKFIKQCTVDFLNSCAGKLKDTIISDGKTLGIYGNASLLAYIGHDGLMDFSLEHTFQPADDKARSAMILACISKKYFAPYLAASKTNPLLWSTGLMSPEAYTLHDAIEAWLNGNNVTDAAAAAYAKYQHCSLTAAKRLLTAK